MTKSFQEVRPTPVTVIGWAWIVIGSVMLMSACGGLVMTLVSPINSSAADLTDVPFAVLWRNLQLLVCAQIVVAIVGVVSGKRFLALKASARTALELLSWLLLVSLVGFAMLWVTNALGMGNTGAAAQPVGEAVGNIEQVEPGGDSGFNINIIFAAMGVLMTLMYSVPVGLMIYHLRSAKVREAMG